LYTQEKIKVLAHRSRYIETARVPKLAKGTSSAAEPEYPAPTGTKGESAEVPKVMGQEKAKSAEAPKRPPEAKEKTTEEPELEESAGLPKILSPPLEVELPKVSKIPAITPKRRRLASVLDAVMESMKVSTPTSTEEKNIKEATKAIITHVETEVGPSAPAETGPVETVGKDTEQRPLDAALVLEKEGTPKKVKSPTPEASTEELDFIIRHASGK
jgi:hypothetical protein